MGFFNLLFGDKKGEARRRIGQLEGQLSSTQNELSSTRVRLERLNQEVEKLKTDNFVHEHMKEKLLELGELQEQLSSTKVEALTSKCNLEASRKEEEELKEQLLNRRKIEEDVEMKLQKVLDLEKQLRFIRAEGLFVKANLEGSRKQEERLKKQLFESERFQQDIGMKLQKILELENEISSYEAEALSDMANLEYTNKEVEELKEKLSLLEKVQEAVVELKLL
uniref:Uncharacterized protein n=1 Tax=Chenopodium quinoa TaxID=63459 RepID=A0A803MH46_CHEQI